MKIKYSKPKGQRIINSCKHIFVGSKHKRPFWIEPVEFGYWFVPNDKSWRQYEDLNRENGYTTTYYVMRRFGLNNCYSLKSCIRTINSWNVPSGMKFKCSLPNIGHHFIVTKK